MRWGMSEKLGLRTLGSSASQPFLGREFGHEADYSQEVAHDIDLEIHAITEQAYNRAKGLLREHLDDLNRIAKILLEVETIDRSQFLRLLDGESAESVFPPPPPEAPAEEPTEVRKEAKPRGLGLPLPGAADAPPAGA